MGRQIRRGNKGLMHADAPAENYAYALYWRQLRGVARFCVLTRVLVEGLRKQKKCRQQKHPKEQTRSDHIDEC